MVIVFNDHAFGNVQRTQKLHFNERYLNSDLKTPDFFETAEAFGAMGLRAKTPEALGQALSAQTPALIEVPVGDMPAWQAIMTSAMHGGALGTPPGGGWLPRQWPLALRQRI